MADIFLSYSRKDLKRVTKLVGLLEKQNFTVWWDPAIVPGKDFTEVIQQALTSARCVIVVWSKHSANSKWVRSEAQFGANTEILVPLTLDGTIPDLFFNQLHTSDFSTWSGNKDDPEMLGLIAAVRGVLGEPLAVPPTQPPKPPRVRSGKKSNKGTNSQNFETFLGCLVFLALLAGVIYGGWQGGKWLGFWGVAEQSKRAPPAIFRGKLPIRE